jgi:hypothetical protein
MNKQLFITSIEAIQDQHSLDVEIAGHLSKAFPNAFEANLLPDNSILQNMLFKILKSEMHDEEGWIEWFCFETDFGTKSNTIRAFNADKSIIPMSNAGELYDFLIKIYET